MKTKEPSRGPSRLQDWLGGVRNGGISKTTTSGHNGAAIKEDTKSILWARVTAELSSRVTSLDEDADNDLDDEDDEDTDDEAFRRGNEAAITRLSMHTLPSQEHLYVVEILHTFENFGGPETTYGGAYSHLPDANKAALEWAERHCQRAGYERYEEEWDSDDGVQIYVSGRDDESWEISIKAMNFTRRVEWGRG
ncbi:MAG: hypothetical protein Q9218_006236 [Villophora microphyllina]